MRARCEPRACPVDGLSTATQAGRGGRAGLLCVLFLLCELAGCSSASASATSDDSGDGLSSAGDDGGPTYAPTYDAVYGEILSPNCALPFCHGGAGDYLQLANADIGYASLVGAPAQGPMCGPTGLERVHPGEPGQSLFFLKVTDPPCGSRMPLEYGYSGKLSVRQIDQIGQWITCGALAGDGGCPADAAPFAWDGAFGDGPGDDGGAADP